MKLLKLVGHPVTVMCTFLLLLISGESFGGFFAIYILLGLPHGVPDALLSVVGLGLILTGYKVYRHSFHPVKSLLYIAGNAIMIYALVIFFHLSKGYNDQTFHQTVPLISFAIFGLCVCCNVLMALMLFVKKPTDNDKHLKVAS